MLLVFFFFNFRLSFGFIVNFLFAFGLPVYYDVAGAYGYASLATRAFGIVEYGQIVYHRYRAVGALFGTERATYTAHFANVHNVLALALGGARHVYGRGGGYALYYVFGAGVYARPATYAPVGVYFRKFVGNFNRAFGADNLAVAATEATVFAEFVSAQK